MDCPSCTRANRPGARFCDACGAALVTRPADVEVARKVVTIVFADLVGSTSLHERLDAESARRLMDGYYRALRAVIDTHGGALVKLLGDGVMAAFGVPRVAEDDALRAVRAGVAMQHAFRDLVREQAGMGGALGLRVGVNTGEVVVSADHTDVVGDPVNVAARLQQEAHDGEVLIGETTQRLVGRLVTLAPFGALALKGRAESVAAFRVVSLARPSGTTATEFVGRDDELRRLAAVFDASVGAPAARLVVILGSPGLGKSRLLAELARRLGERATVLTARCEAAGGATFAPIAEAVRSVLRLDDAEGDDAVRVAIDAVVPGDEVERARIAGGIAALLAGSPASPEETFFVVRRLLAALATTRPVVLAIDDLQWAEPLLLDLTEHLVQWSVGVPLLVVAARPELHDTRSALATRGGLVSDVVTLAGLDAGAATRLAANVIGAAALPAAVAGRVLATSEGNPLFVGELVRMLVHDGVLTREGDHWTAGASVADLDIPPTIHALLAARIERLRPDDRAVLERAAVVGRQFSRAAIAHLLSPEQRHDLDARLESLRRSELIEPDAGSFVGEPALRFHHLLTRDAAYRRLLKDTRAELHGRFADWLETRVGGAVEHDETIGWHLEQAYQHLRELGPVDERARAFGERASRHLAAAGRRALSRDDLARAASLLGRALEPLDAAAPARADLALDWCEALLAAGDVAPAGRAVAELDRLAAGSERLRAWHTCFAGQLAVMTDPQALRATVDAVAGAAEALESAGDAAGEAKAHSVHANALARLGRIGASEAALDRALAAARRARDRRRANAVLAGAPLAALWGPSPVTHASGRCLDVVRVLRITQGAPAVEAVALRCQAVLEALRGRAEAARRMIASSRRLVEELGITHRLLEADMFAGLIDLLEGDAGAAEGSLRTAYEGLRDHGLGIDAAQAAALLGRALLVQGRATEAESLSHESETLAGDDLKAAIAWRGVRAEALARRGEHVAGVELARTAVAIAAATDALLDHADARLALAAALRVAGRHDEADAEEAHAIELWEAKGATLLADRARGGAPETHAVARTGEAARAMPRRVQANAATANAARLDAAVAARDLDGIHAVFAGGAESVDHRTGTAYAAREARETDRSMLGAHDLTFGHEPLATLGDRLALCRGHVSCSILAQDVAWCGISGTDPIVVLEVDARGQRLRTDLFAIERMGDAVVRLFGRHAELLPEGPERSRAVATARAAAALLAPPSVARYRTAIAPDVAFHDHRSIGLGAGLGADGFLRGLGTLIDASAETAIRVDDIVALQSDAILMRWTNFGTERAGGGAYERVLLLLWVFGPAGLLGHFEQFDADRVVAALARFDELTAVRRDARLANAVCRAQLHFERCWRERDWDGVVACFDPTFAIEDRRALVGLDLAGEAFRRNLRILFTTPASAWHTELLATRGDRLALFRTRFAGEVGDGGPLEDDHLAIVEHDARDRRIALVGFDADDLAEAYQELDARYDAGEAMSAPHVAMTRAFRRAFAARDWDALATWLAPDLIVYDHRLLGWETIQGPAAYLEALRALVDLAPDVELRIDHFRMSGGCALYVPVWLGTHEGGTFETPSVIVAELDTRGRIRRFDQYDLAQLADAQLRFEALRAAP